MKTTPISRCLYALLRSKDRIATPKDLAFRVGVNEATVYRWSNGESVPDANQVVEICRALKTSAPLDVLSRQNQEV